MNITGEQIGAYFGYSMCALDVDGDGLDDLIIGAPMYTTPNNEGKYENGRIYIMYQGKFVSTFISCAILCSNLRVIVFYPSFTL